MKIKRILTQYRRDFRAIFECQFCGYEEEKNGYDDEYFHTIVVPNMKCPECGKSVIENMDEMGEIYRPLTTQYPEGFQV